jgi:predicted Zn-dependent protease
MEVTNVMLKILQPLNTVVAEVEFLQILQSFEIFDFSDAVRLQRKDFEASQTVEILTAIESINVT